MHGCMLTTIANQMRAIGQNLVAIGSTGFRPLLCLGARRLAVLIADNLDLCNDLSMRDVGIAVVIEHDALTVLGDDNDLVGLEVLVRRRVGSRQRGGEQAWYEHGMNLRDCWGARRQVRSQRRTDAPGGKLFLADVVPFALGLLAAGDLEQFLEDLAAD